MAGCSTFSSLNGCWWVVEPVALAILLITDYVYHSSTYTVPHKNKMKKKNPVSTYRNGVGWKRPYSVSTCWHVTFRSSTVASHFALRRSSGSLVILNLNFLKSSSIGDLYVLKVIAWRLSTPEADAQSIKILIRWIPIPSPSRSLRLEKETS